MVYCYCSVEFCLLLLLLAATDVEEPKQIWHGVSPSMLSESIDQKKVKSTGKFSVVGVGALPLLIGRQEGISLVKIHSQYPKA